MFKITILEERFLTLLEIGMMIWSEPEKKNLSEA